MHDAPEHHSSSSGSHSSGRQHHHHHHHPRATGTAYAPIATSRMATSSMESIGHKLHRLEKRLEEENNAPDIMIGPSGDGRGGGELGSGVVGVGVGVGIGRTPRPHLSAAESTPNRSSMRLPVMSTTNHNAPETEMQKKLKLIRKQSGILTINGQKYPSKISDLEHVSDLGNGTSGNVVKMCHKPTGTIIAVKQMRGTGNKEENNRILMDLDVILNSHDCKYIVHCLGYFVNGQDVWICMELMSMCFDKLLKLSKQAVPEHILGKVTVATVKALSYLKVKHNVIHRDVKPSNILIDERGSIKLCDFGISGRLVDSKANTRSAGCAAYMAPERIDPRKPEYDIRADVWSLGITLVELATGSSPYEGCNIDFEVLTKILDNEPPSLPYGDGCNFSKEFRNFVDKCLTKNFVERPKYPELRQQPFFRYYDEAEVNVAQWFKTVVELSGIETHRTHMPATLRGDLSTANKHNKSAIAAIATTAANPNTTTITPATTAMTINAKSTQIPSFQNSHHQQSHLQPQPQQHAPLNRYKKDDYFTQPHQLQQPQQPHQQQQHHQPSQLPQPIASYYNNTANNHLQGERGGGGGVGVGVGVGGGGIGVGGNGSGSNSAASTSPQSPPSVGGYKLQQTDDGGVHIVSDMNKLYRKSPFLQRKYSNGAAFKYSAESPKKESMFSSIGQSIIRNLTTSPFSQKKHSTPLPHQIDPLWRMPTVPDAGGSNAFDICDAASTKTLTASPALGRKRFQATTAAATTTATAMTNVATDPKQQQPSLIPINRNETNPQRVQGNHSPIVLQRFYHQQNQLREREWERQQHQHQQFTRNSPESTNPFLSSYQPATATTTTPASSQLHYNHYQLPHQQQTHNPLAASSSHSTSSQSSTQSSSSQIAVSELQQRTAPHSPPPPAPAASAAFGASVGQLQYQPLPQQYLPLHSTLRNSRSPPTSPEQMSDGGGGGLGSSGGTASKLGKMYARRQLQATTAASSSNAVANSSGGVGVGFGVGSAAVHGACKENNFKDEHGWFNSLAGAMKRQFASYVKLQLHSAATAGVPSSNGSAESPAAVAAAAPSGKSSLPYYRALSTGSSSNTSNSTSPTEAPTKGVMGPSGHGNGVSRVDDFYDKNNGGSGTSSSFLRRYAAAGASGMAGPGSASGATAHLLSGLDRRHRSPDPPPRYNRGQSPLLLRKNLLELGGQPPGSPLLNRRFVSASPPLPPPRRGSESVPGSPQHFRTRIHYTPEPQRRIYRTIDQ